MQKKPSLSGEGFCLLVFLVFLKFFIDGFKIFLFDFVVDIINKSGKQRDGNDGNSVNDIMLFR